jgi:hypothetical protein
MTTVACGLFALTLAAGCGAERTGNGAPTNPVPPGADQSGWLTYANAQYGFTLRYPPTLATVQLKSDFRPVPVIRLGFFERTMINSPILDREIPRLGIDVYDNASRASLDSWLEASGLLGTVVGLVRDQIELGGVPGIRLAARAQLFPNVFYFVARGPFVYRFTPVGADSDEMLATVRFSA